MSLKTINTLIILSSFIGYLEWGHGNSTILVVAEAEVWSKLFVDPMSVLHPLIQLPLIGQLLLLVTLFQKVPKGWLSVAGTLCLSSLMAMVLLVGLLSVNILGIASALPFFVFAFMGMRTIWKQRQEQKSDPLSQP